MSLPKKCPICKTNNTNISVVTSHISGGKKGGAFFKCEKCKIIFQHPFMSISEEKLFYLKDFEDFMQKRSKDGKWQNAEENNKLNLSTYERRFKYLKTSLNKNIKKILEIGCSSGFMLKPLIEQGYDCSGIEPSGKYQKYLKSKNINLFSNIKSVLQKKIKFDLIMHFFVFEHIRDPINFINIQKKILNKKGKIIFEIPCYEDPLYKLYDLPNFERFYWSKAHPYYYNKDSLEFILKKNKVKYELFFEQRYNLANHLYWFEYGRPGGQDMYKNLISKKQNEIYKRKILNNGFGDTLVCIIKND